MAIEHSTIADAQRHEPKGASTASSKQVYVSDGAASGVWRQMANGSTYFENIGTPYTLTYPATYTKIAPTTTAGGISSGVTEGTNCRLTYTGTTTLSFNCHAHLSVAQAVGANRDLRFAVYKNGSKVNGSVCIVTTTSAVKTTVAIACDVSLATNDYVEIWAQNDGASGDILVYSMNLMLDPQEN